MYYNERVKRERYFAKKTNWQKETKQSRIYQNKSKQLNIPYKELLRPGSKTTSHNLEIFNKDAVMNTVPKSLLLTVKPFYFPSGIYFLKICLQLYFILHVPLGLVDYSN